MSDAPLPLISILIPTHERPDYLELALKSALAQTYGNFEVVISDNSESDASREMLAPYLAAHPRLRYHRQVGGGYMDNWLNALRHSEGEYVAFLMDDDLFHPEKLSRMAQPFIAYGDKVGLVTSFRQLIDEQGRELPALPTTRRLFENDCTINGSALGDFVLRNGMNVIGEPTTVLLRRADIGDRFGVFCGHQYQVLSDLSTWMQVMAGKQCVYLKDAMSYFRMHAGQDQRRKSTALKANLEWLRLLLDGHANGLYITDKTEFHELLATKLSGLVPFLAQHHAEIREGDFDVPAIQALIARALGMLMTP